MDLLPGQADDVDEQALGQPVLAHDAGRRPSTQVGQAQVALVVDDEQPVALHPGDRLGDRGTALVQALGDAGPHGRHALFLEFDHRAQVHLRGVDQLTHLHPGPKDDSEPRLVAARAADEIANVDTLVPCRP